MEIYELPYQLNTKVGYDFYHKYLGSNHFKEKFESRIEYIKNKYENNKITDDKLIEHSTNPELIHKRLEHLVDIVIDGGYIGNIPSTVVDCTK